MIIDGRAIAKEIFDILRTQTQSLKEKGITPKVAIVLVGEDPASVAYVRQKELKAESIGAKSEIIHLPTSVTQEELLTTLEKLNNDPTIHGIIVQRPLPQQIEGTVINQATKAEKDIDAFRSDAPYDMPLAAAVLRILENVHPADFLSWLKTKNIVVIGKGETGGGPVIAKLQKLGVTSEVIDSKTESPEKLTEHADIIVSTVGKKDVMLPQTLKKNVIAVIVGMYRGDDGKLRGDYDKEILDHTASFYTPVPGGVGPVNVAMLLANLVDAASKTS